MTMRPHLRYFGWLAVLAVLAAAGAPSVQAEAQAGQRPNVILCMADDLGWGDTGYNGNPIIQTPHLNRMASEGVRFNRFYSASAVCSPTRASVLTGRHPHRSGVFSANVGVLRPEELTMAEYLKAQGYATGHFGKWHLGTLTREVKDSNRGGPKHPELYNPPSEHGFDSWFSTEAKVPTWDPMRIPVKMGPDESARFGWRAIEAGEPSKAYGTAYWSRDGRVTENLTGDDSRVIMDRAIPFIRQAVADQLPFLAVIWFHAPHLPCVAGPEYAARYAEHDFLTQQYAGCITALDEQMGRLRSELESLGVADNTMLCFTSDNGPERQTPGSTGGLRGRKHGLLEGGVRVPGLMVWPARVKQPMVVNAPVSSSDYFPTVVEAVGEPLPAAAHVCDGRSLLPLLATAGAERKSPIGFVYSKQGAYVEDRYKLHIESLNPFAGLRLYDVVADPKEGKDLAAGQPERLKRMSEQWEAWLQSCADSFHGSEYGDAPLKRVPQRWPH